MPAHNERAELASRDVVARAIVRSAHSRQESRGLHFSRDYPEMSTDPKPTILSP